MFDRTANTKKQLKTSRRPPRFLCALWRWQSRRKRDQHLFVPMFFSFNRGQRCHRVNIKNRLVCQPVKRKGRRFLATRQQRHKIGKRLRCLTAEARVVGTEITSNHKSNSRPHAKWLHRVLVTIFASLRT